MDSYSSGNADLWRGSAIAVALVALVILGYAAIANSRLWHEWTAPKRTRVSTVPMAAPKDYAPHLHPMGTDLDTRGSPAGDAAPPEEPGAGAGGGAALGPPAVGGAAQALREALRSFRLDPKRTTTISISSTGRTRLDGRGDLTAIDGLPMDSVRGALLLSGTGTASGPPAGP
jgi:hypothetical protein